ncbi:MAG: PEP-CTERM sorting domain-containing protein [Acidobacteria bacterium]|nr:PEP-CTERM sorting domain-containing protein [Acidobacteriota bacterium]MCA1649509.1 PEP-CTERM sorting domain-containing protein [Acidobacteriota bacterium]
MAPVKRRRRGARGRRARRLAVLAGALVTAAVSVGLMLKAVPPVGSAAAVHLPDLPPAPAVAADRGTYAERLAFPYSVIDGGATSVEELRAAIDNDPVVAEHYAGFDLARTRVERLDAPKLAHVSYRVGADVFWTRRPVIVPAGETVLTDGQRMARTRCANQLASQPGAVADLEPPASVLDTPVLTLLPRTYGPFGIAVPKLLSPPILDIGIFGPPGGPGFISNVPVGESGPWIGPTSTTGLTPDAGDGTPLWPENPDRPIGDLPLPPSPEEFPFPNPFFEPLPPFNPELPPTVPTEPPHVPEPGTLLLTLSGITAYTARRLRTRRQRSEFAPIVD